MIDSADERKSGLRWKECRVITGHKLEAVVLFTVLHSPVSDRQCNRKRTARRKASKGEKAV